MHRWALVMAGLYALILAVLTVPFILLTLTPDVRAADALKAYLHWQYWLWLAVMALSQFGLLLVPVRVASLRPITKGALWPALLACGLMAGGLAAGAAYSILEHLSRGKVHPDWLSLLPIFLGVSIWGIWATVFTRLAETGASDSFVSRQCRFLFRGSVLELLIAVPTHLVARSRDYCCAGFMTFIGLTMGISVMLFSFGPAVLWLYVARWQRLHPKQPAQVSKPVGASDCTRA
ncbi:MAG: hypothetical protein AB9869_34880 [Verrucomicrobiia bacterium]